jgi:hypothetical protein
MLTLNARVRRRKGEKGFKKKLKWNICLEK